jgi:hypothetical protein
VEPADRTGIGSTIFLFVYPGTISMLTVITNFVASGANLAVAHKVLKERDALFADHPTKTGYIAFYK